MTETNLYDSIALADRIKLQCKSRNVQIKDVMDSANLSNGTLYNLRSGKMLKADSLARIAPWTSSWGAPLTPPYSG